MVYAPVSYLQPYFKESPNRYQGNLGCCPRDENCCGSSFCVKPGESCCQGFTCEAGWNCCTYPYCYPDGGNCCSDGSYCTAGNICVNVRGSIKCCTDLTCSGHASGSVTISTPSATTASTVIPSSITKVPESSITLTPILVYEYYYYTITWFADISSHISMHTH